jgi:uncharacterized protein YjdB
MKNTIGFFGVIALVAVIGFTMAACGDPAGGGDPGGDPVPTVTGVTVSPATPDVVKGNTITFTATVTGTNHPAQTVTWSIDQTNKNAGTAINASGVLTVAAAETLASLTVKATSTVDASKSGTATVTISSSDIRPETPESMSGKTAMQYFTDNNIKVGWNLGNSLDAVIVPSAAVETAWGNPRAT